jgi:hypothetical protein
LTLGRLEDEWRIEKVEDLWSRGHAAGIIVDSSIPVGTWPVNEFDADPGNKKAWQQRGQSFREG